MKTAILTLSLMLPLLATAEERNVLAGQYAGCEASMETTTQNPKSNFYVFTFGDDSSLNIVKEMYEGTEKCDRQPVGRVEYKNFVVLEDSGNHPGRWMTAQEVGTKLFFKLTIARSYTAITSSLDYPVKHDFVDLGVLNKVQ